MNATFFLAIFLVFSVSLVTGQCPNSTWIHRGEKCFFVKSEKGDFFENIALCNQLNASLVSIVSKKENDEVSKVANDFWLGLGLDQNSKSSKDFYWLDGSPFVYNSWKYEPQDTDDKYWAAFSREGTWHVDKYLAFGQRTQMCSINLKASTSYKKTPNPLDLKEGLVAGQCPNSTWIRRGNKCYFVKRELADFYENIALCNRLNASMVSIVNEKENIEVARLTSPRTFWLGLGYNSSKHFYWFDGSPFVYNSWTGDPFFEEKYWAARFWKGEWMIFSWNAFGPAYQMCSINLNASTSYKRKENPAETKEILVNKQCPNATWIRQGNKCYFIKREKADFYENIALCNQLNASLVSISSEEENIQVSHLIVSTTSHTAFWLGLGQRSKYSKQYYWFDGSPYVYENFGYFEFSQNKYFAGILNMGLWFVRTPFWQLIQVCSLDLNANAPPKKTPTPVEIKDTGGQCANKAWKRIGNKCVFINIEKVMNYTENQAYCKKMNSTMVSIHSDAENILLSRIAPDEIFWIGFKEISGSKNLYEWEDGSPVTFESWRKYRLFRFETEKKAAFSWKAEWWVIDKNFPLRPSCQMSLATDAEAATTGTTTDANSQITITAESVNAISKSPDSVSHAESKYQDLKRNLQFTRK